MKLIRILPVLLLVSVFSHAQYWHVGIFGGLSAYNGDLVDRLLPSHGQTKPALGLDVSYELNDHVNIRAGFIYGRVAGYDKYINSLELKNRNLSFETSIMEGSLVGEYNFFSLYERRFTPYAYGGLAVFHYNPYAYDLGNNKVDLKPLSTEGQGIAGYNIRPYSLTQPAVPLGVGVKFAISDNLRVGVEASYRVLFTDYLDDVSKTYIDEADLLAAKGQKAVDMSYRGNEIPTGSPLYPAKGVNRGNASAKDAYYFIGLRINMRLGSFERNESRSRGSKKGYGCPTNVL